MPLDNKINYRLNQISRHWSALVVAMARTKYNLNPDAIKTLSVIASYQPVSPTDIMERTTMDSPKVARTLRTLVAEGLVQREVDPSDGRRAVVTTTAKGDTVNSEVEALSKKVEQMVLASLSKDEVRALYQILDKVEFVVGKRLSTASWSELEQDAPQGGRTKPRGSATVAAKRRK